MAKLSMLPVTQILEPADQQELLEIVRQCSATQTPMYPLGGATCPGFGLPAKREGVAISLQKLNRIVDYPARDMTVTVEAGVTLRQLSEQLAEEKQGWPIDAPRASEATVGGVVATNFNGPRRYGRGTVRDHVIGIHAINSQGQCFKGGGRVVKNVAGYDFCKLLTGSLGTLAILTQFTLRLSPVPPAFSLMACYPRDWAHTEQLLAALSQSRTRPAAIELVAGPAWRECRQPQPRERLPTLLVALEGAAVEVAWMEEQLDSEWTQLGVDKPLRFDEQATRDLWRELVEFPAGGQSPLTVKASLRPGRLVSWLQVAAELDANCSVQCHAGNGVAIVRFSEIPEAGLASTLIGKLRPAAGEATVIVLESAEELTPQCAWGSAAAPAELLASVKREFDPADLFNPGRFLYR